MNKQCITMLIALSVSSVTLAKPFFIACPSHIKAAHPGQIIKTNSGTWEVTIDKGNNIDVPKSVPGLMKMDHSKIVKMVCYDDAKFPFPKYIDNTKPIYNVYFTYKGTCKNPVVNKERNGFACY